MPVSLTMTVAPTQEPILLEELKRYLRIDGTDEDVVLEALLVAAREEIEMFTGKTLLATTYALRLDDFPACGWVSLPRPPAQSITSITYLDTANVSQTLATTVYGSDTYTEPGRVYLHSGQSWPSTHETGINTVTITYVAGYTLATLPDRFRMVLKLMVGDLYEHREGHLEARVTMNETMKRMLWGLRLVDMY